MMVTALMGALVISLIVLTVSSNLELTKNQLMVFHKIQSSQSASVTIVSALRYYMAKKKYYIYRLMKSRNNVIDSPFLIIAKDKQAWKKIMDPEFKRYI